jgi:hypothetical protein
VKFTVVIGLTQDTAEAALVLVVAGGGVNDEGIRSVFFEDNLQQVQSKEHDGVC